jgi:hypothetical protein
MDALFDDETDAKITKACRIWEEATHNLDGTPAETYLYSLGGSPPWPSALRYSADCYHGVGRQSFPAMIAAVTDPSGSIRGIQRHYLAEDVMPPRLMLGAIVGNAVRLGFWPTRKSELIVAESLALGLKLHFRTGMPVLAALSAAGIARLTLSPDDALTNRTIGHRILIAPTSAAGRTAAERCVPTWQHGGHHVRIVDAADLLASLTISSRIGGQHRADAR